MIAELGFDSCWEQGFWSSPPYFNWFQVSHTPYCPFGNRGSFPRVQMDWTWT